VGGHLKPHPLEVTDVGWFSKENLPSPLVGFERWGEHVFAALEGEERPVHYDAIRSPNWRDEEKPS